MLHGLTGTLSREIVPKMIYPDMAELFDYYVSKSSLCEGTQQSRKYTEYQVGQSSDQ